MSDVRHPEIVVSLIGNDGNAFAIIGRVSRALRRHNVPSAEVAEFETAATSGDYDNVLLTALRWVTVN